MTYNDYLGIFWIVIKYFLIAAVVIIFISLLVGFIRVRICEGRFQKSVIASHKNKRSLFLLLFFDLPFQIFRDFWRRSSGDFPYYGLWIIVGEQGSGKTTTMTYLLNKISSDYPAVSVFTNYTDHFPGVLKDPHSFNYLLNCSPTGTLFAVDELQNWFSSSDSKNFPVEYLEFFTQLRKAYCLTIGTSQVFERLSKPLREQTRCVFAPKTFFGCFTVCDVYVPTLISSGDGSVESLKRIKRFCFVQTDELRACFDTRKKIKHQIIK